MNCKDIAEFAGSLGPKALVTAFAVCIETKSAARTGEALGAASALQAVSNAGSQPRFCGQSARGLPVLCLSPVPHFKTIATLADPAAITLGHFVLCKEDRNCTDPNSPTSTRDQPNVLMHEMVHVRQWEEKGESFLPEYAAGVKQDLDQKDKGPLYGTGSLCGNPLEAEAYRVAPRTASGDLERPCP